MRAVNRPEGVIPLQMRTFSCNYEVFLLRRASAAFA